MSEQRFKVGDIVLKVKGYRVAGEVRAVFTNRAGDVRYAVEVEAEGGTTFFMIYSGDQLELKVTP